MASWNNIEIPQIELPNTGQESINLLPRMYTPMLQRLDENELKEVREAAYKAFDKTGLKDKGLDILNITDDNKAEVLEQIKQYSREALAKKTKLQKLGLYIQAGVGKILNPVSAKTMVNAIAECESAAYTPTINKFLINMNSAPDLLFHEIGHALTDKNGNFLSKLNIKSRLYVLALAPIFLITSLIKSPKKNKEDKPQGAIDKTTTFIKNNCGKLVAASFIPILIDEALASIKGQKLAKDFISSKKILKGIKKTHLMAYGTYILAPVFTGGISYLLVKLRDKLAKKKNTEAV